VVRQGRQLHSAELHLVERFTLTDRDHIAHDVTWRIEGVHAAVALRPVLYRRTEPRVQLLDTTATR
jgi:hypothetical protein